MPTNQVEQTRGNVVNASPQRILAVAADSIVPAPSGSGNSAIRWGLLSGLLQCGVEVGYFAANLPERNVSSFLKAELHFSSESRQGRFRHNKTLDASALAEFMSEFRPNVVLVYGTEPLRLVREAGFSGSTGIMSIDLPHISLATRHIYNIRFGRPRQKLKSIMLTPKIACDVAKIYRNIVDCYPMADFVINHAAHHARWHERKHGKPVLYTPNPLEPIYEQEPTRCPTFPPRFALVGGIGGISTLAGLAWFARKVYPLLESALASGEIEVHLIGKGTLDPALDRITPHLIRRGFVEDLTKEFANMTAMLVPTPITLGFRTRIIDAFRHGVTVVAHEANRAGFPELSHNVNAIVAGSPKSFVAGILELAADSKKANQLGRNAFEQFNANFNAARSAEKILSFIKDSVSE